MKISKSKIHFAKQAKVDLYRKGIAKILTALGHEEAWVSDESTLWDFAFEGSFEVEDDRFLSLQDLSRILGVGVEGRSSLADRKTDRGKVLMKIPLEAFHAAQAAALAGDLDTAWRILRENYGRPIAGAASCECLECFSRFAYGPLYKQAVKDHQKAEALAAAQAATLAGDIATSARIIQENRLGKRCAFCLNNPLKPHLRVDKITVVRGVQVHAHSLCLAAALSLHRIRSWETGRWIYIRGLL